MEITPRSEMMLDLSTIDPTGTMALLYPVEYLATKCNIAGDVGVCQISDGKTAFRIPSPNDRSISYWCTQ